EAGPALAPGLLPDRRKERPKALHLLLRLLLRRPARPGRAARQAVAQQLRQVAGVLVEVVPALAVERLVVLLVGLLGVALLGVDVLEQLVAVPPGLLRHLGGQVEALADKPGEARPGRVERLAADL